MVGRGRCGGLCGVHHRGEGKSRSKSARKRLVETKRDVELRRPNLIS